MAATNAFSIRKVTVRADRIIIRASCAANWLYTTPAVAKRAVFERPNLPRHACVNGKDNTFGAVIAHTPLPHLYEHLVIDLLAERNGVEETVFVGTSEWAGQTEGDAIIELSFVDDIEALGAIKDAAILLNSFLCE